MGIQEAKFEKKTQSVYVHEKRSRGTHRKWGTEIRRGGASQIEGKREDEGDRMMGSSIASIGTEQIQDDVK